MQKFGENGNEFWWNDDDQDTLGIIIGVMVIIVGIFFFQYIKAPMIDLFYVACFMVLFGVAIGRTVYLRRRKIPNLYMNEQGLKINGSFIEWNWVINVEIKKVPAERGSRPKDRIFIYYHKPGKKRKFSTCLMPEESEVTEIKEYIEAFWNYYKTSSSETGEITV